MRGIGVWSRRSPTSGSTRWSCWASDRSRCATCSRSWRAGTRRRASRRTASALHAPTGRRRPASAGVSAAARRGTTLTAALALTLGACAGHGIVGGVYQAPSGYRVTLPGAAWEVAPDSRADLELRHRTAPAGMLVNALCDPAVVRRGGDVLAQHLLLGMRDRQEMAVNEMPVNGRAASHRLLEGRMRQSDERVRIESYTLKGERCVYDLLYVAAPEVFEAWRSDFHSFVESFTGE